MRKLDLKKGDKVIVAIIPQSNASRYKDMSIQNIDNWTYEANAVTVGRKYITTNFGKNMKFMIDDGLEYSDYPANYKIYLTKEDVFEERQNEELWILAKNKFSSWSNVNGYTTNQLKQVLEILNENKSE